MFSKNSYKHLNLSEPECLVIEILKLDDLRTKCLHTLELYVAGKD